MNLESSFWFGLALISGLYTFYQLTKRIKNVDFKPSAVEAYYQGWKNVPSK